jgi:hypothetical protein
MWRLCCLGPSFSYEKGRIRIVESLLYARAFHAVDVLYNFGGDLHVVVYRGRAGITWILVSLCKSY